MTAEEYLASFESAPAAAAKPLSEMSFDERAEAIKGGLREQRAEVVAKGQTAALRNMQAEEQSRQRMVTMGQEGNIPLNLDEGAPADMRAAASFRRTTGDKVAYLSQLPGVFKVRTTPDGDIIIRVADLQTGGQRDILFDEMRPSAKDITDMAGDAPAIAASIAAALYTGGGSFWAQLLASSGAGIGVRTIQDTATRLADDQPVALGEQALARGGDFLMDAALPVAGKAGKAATQKLLSPFLKSAGLVEQNAAKAAANITAKTGIDIPLSAGQRTGSSALLRAESFGESILGGGRLGERKALQDERVRAVQEYLMGGPKVPAEGEISERAADTLGKQAQGLSDEATMLRQQAAKELQGRIEGTFSIVSGMRRKSVTPTQVGAQIREAVANEREVFRATNRANYGEVLAAPGGSDPFVPTNPIKETLDEIKAALPKGVKDVEPSGTGIFDSAGREITTGGGKQQVVLDEFVPPELKKFLNVGGKLPDSMTLQEATQMRSFINDLIDEGKALPGIPDRYLTKLAASLTKAIGDGVDNAPNPEIKALLTKANGYYRKEFAKFEEDGVRQLFKPSTQAGAVADPDVVSRLLAGGGDVAALRRYRAIVGGETSPAYRGIRRLVADSVLDDATLYGSDTVDAAAFLKRLGALNTEFRREILGDAAESSLKEAGVLLASATGKKIDEATANIILNGSTGNPTKLIKAAIAREEALDEIYNTRFMRDIVGGRLNTADINPQEFVTRFVGKASGKQMDEVLNLLKTEPDLIDDIKRKAVQNALQRSARASTPEDIAARQAGDSAVPVVAPKLNKILGSQEGENLKKLLGDDSYKLMEDYLAIEAARYKKSEVGKEAGSLVQAGIVSRLLQADVGAAIKVARLKAASALLGSDFFVQWAGSLKGLKPWPRWRTSIIASAPVARALAEEFRDEPEMLVQVLDTIRDADEQEFPGGDVAQPSVGQSAEDYLAAGQ